MPETLQALIAARLDGLEPTDRCAAPGRRRARPELHARRARGRHRRQPARRSRRGSATSPAGAARQLVDPRSPERGQYVFVQALIREVAYGTLAKRDRRTRHLAAARFFESLGEDELAGALAAHYLAAYEAVPEGPEGDALAVQARLALTGAADRAVALGSPEQAMTFLTQAAAVTSEPTERAAILERLGRAATAAARPDVAATNLKEAIAIRRAAGDEAGAYRATLWLAEGYMSGRLIDDMTPVLEEAVAYGPGVADEADLAAMIALLANARRLEQRNHEAVALADRALEIAERLDLYETMASALITKGGILANHGRPVEGLSLIGTARELANDHGLLTIESRALTNLTIIMASRDVQATWDLEMQALEFARRIGRRDSELTVIGNAGEDAVRLGDWDWVGNELAAFDEVDLPVVHRFGATLSVVVVALLRGAPDAATRVASLQATSASLADNDVSAGAEDLIAWIGLAAGDFGVARDGWLKQGDTSDTERPIRVSAGRQVSHPRARCGRGAQRARAPDAQRHAWPSDRCGAAHDRGRHRRPGGTHGRVGERVSTRPLDLGRDGSALGSGVGDVDRRRSPRPVCPRGSGLGRRGSDHPRAARCPRDHRPPRPGARHRGHDAVPAGGRGGRRRASSEVAETAYGAAVRLHDATDMPRDGVRHPSNRRRCCPDSFTDMVLLMVRPGIRPTEEEMRCQTSAVEAGGRRCSPPSS